MFIYSDSDCGTCLIKDMNLLKQITRLTEGAVWAINRSSQGKLAELGEIPGVTYVNVAETNLAEQLSYVATPLTVRLGKENEILAVHFNTLFDDSDRANTFLSELNAR